MTSPNEPEDLATSVRLPEPEPEPIYDTGSDGWWRAQAKAQREAADQDPPPPAWSTEPTVEPMYEPMFVTPPELVEPQVLLPEEAAPPQAELPTGPETLADLAPTEVFAIPEPEPEPEPEPAPVTPQPSIARPTHVPQPADTWYDENPSVRQPFDEEPPRGGRQRLLGGLLAVAGVGLAVLALLWLRDAPTGTPTVATSPAATAGPTATPEPTATPDPTQAPTPQPTVTTAPPVAQAPVVPLLVLNNSKVSKLAERSAAKFRAGGWPIRDTGNFTGRLEQTTIYYPPGQRASAERFAKQFPMRVLPRFDGLPGSGMTVVVTRDYA